MQKIAVTAAETICCAAQKNDQLIFAAFLSAAHSVHSRIEAYLQVMI